jgi:hypothetical protein
MSKADTGDTHRDDFTAWVSQGVSRGLQYRDNIRVREDTGCHAKASQNNGCVRYVRLVVLLVLVVMSWILISTWKFN